MNPNKNLKAHTLTTFKNNDPTATPELQELQPEPKQLPTDVSKTQIKKQNRQPPKIQDRSPSGGRGGQVSQVMHGVSLGVWRKHQAAPRARHALASRWLHPLKSRPLAAEESRPLKSLPMTTEESLSLIHI